MKEIESQKKGSLAGRMLRLFKIDGSFQESTSMRGEIAFGNLTGESYHKYHKRNETALLEAAQKKAEALLERQKHPFIY
ncbi:hypothetical protein GWN65_04450 [Candidatus Bathyarchaeota archaeon]|nr:hypothetical protein [Candidatus Bathyarchaeota archaeon]NIV44381.1 hypothetical protein [Candidatus Bathyarchaeota archaeon]